MKPLPVSSLLILNLIACATLGGADFVGQSLEFLTSDPNSSQPSLSSFALSMESGAAYDFGSGLLHDPQGRRYFYYWSSELGRLSSRTPEGNHVTYTAPRVARETTDLVFVWVGSEAGLSAQGVVTVTVLPAGAQPSPTARLTGQISASYSETTGNFSIAYALGAGVSAAAIQASFDGNTWFSVGSINVGSDGSSGLRTVSVPGSANHRELQLRLEVSGSGGPTQTVRTTSLSYQPIPTAPKTSEVPARPSMTAQSGSSNSVGLSWQRVNDSLGRDNVNSYELRYSVNPVFSPATTVNLGNPALRNTGFETLQHTVTGLSGGTIYHFQLRAANAVGPGQWSNPVTIKVRSDGPPIFPATNPVEPSHGASGVSTRPWLRWTAIDPNQGSLDYRVLLGESPGNLVPVRPFASQLRTGLSEFGDEEWIEGLKPNTTYYWRVETRQPGKSRDDYGGAYPISPIWSFTTANTGSSLNLVSAQLINGSISPSSRFTYRITVRNEGNAPSAANSLRAYYVKGVGETPFLMNLGGEIPELAPGATTITDLTLGFSDSVFTSPSGFFYDNVLTSGSTEIRLRTLLDDIQNFGTPSLTIPVNYYTTGGPEIRALIIRGDSSGEPYTPKAGAFLIASIIEDDLQTTKVRFEYRFNHGAWQFLDEYTGNSAAFMYYDRATHTGATSPIGWNAVRWQLPAAIPITSSLQVRVTAWDNDGVTTAAVSPPLSVINDTLNVVIGGTEHSHYQGGDIVSFPLRVIAPGPIGSFSVDLDVPGRERRTLLQQNSAGEAELTIPPVMSVTLPGTDFYDHPSACIEVHVSAQTSSGNFVDVTHRTPNTFTIETRDLSAPFNEAINILPEPFDFPVDSTHRAETEEPIKVRWEGDSRVHLLFRRKHLYTLAGTEFSGSSYFHIVYDQSQGVVSRHNLGSLIEYFDLEVANGIVFLLSRVGNTVYFHENSSGTFITNQPLVNVLHPLNGHPHLFRHFDNVYFGWVHQADQPSSQWRNRFLRLSGSSAPVLEHPYGYMGPRPNYGSHLSSRLGVFALNQNLTAGAQVRDWFSFPISFRSDTPDIIGAQFAWGADMGRNIVNFAESNNGTTVWDCRLQQPNIRANAQFLIGVGEGVAALGSSNESMRHVVVRKDRASGDEVRMVLPVNSPMTYHNVDSRSDINEYSNVAVAWRGKLAVGRLAADDILAPAVEIRNDSDLFRFGEEFRLEWDQIETGAGAGVGAGSYAIYRVEGGQKIAVTGGQASFGTRVSRVIPMPNELRIRLRLEVFDSSGNRGVAEKVFRQVPAVVFDSFEVDSLSVEAGQTLSFNWNALPNDPLRVLTLLSRPVGSHSWEVLGSVTGDVFQLETGGLNGDYEFRVETPGGAASLSRAVSIEGGFEFVTEAFAPAGGSLPLSASDPQFDLFWGSVGGGSATSVFQVIGRWNGDQEWVELGRTSGNKITVRATGPGSLQWRVLSNHGGDEFSSPVFSVELVEMQPPSSVEFELLDLGSARPKAALTWSASPHASEYAVLRTRVADGVSIEIGRGFSESFVDEDLMFGETYIYQVSSLHQAAVSEWSPSLLVQVPSGEPSGIEFLNSNYEVLPGNSVVVSWNIFDPVGTATFRSFEVLLRRGNGAVVQHWPSFEGVPGATSAVSLENLLFSEGYVLEVYTLGSNGKLLGNAPARHHFTTGADNRIISSPPTVTSVRGSHHEVVVEWLFVEGADEFEIFRRVGTGNFSWLGTTVGFSWRDGDVRSGESVSYLVRAQNGVSESLSVTSAPFRVPDPPYYRPDAIIGRSFVGGVGNNVYSSNPVSQRLVVRTARARNVRLVYTAENDGTGDDVINLSGGRGDQFFRVLFRNLGGGNVTSAMTAGRHKTELLFPGERERVTLEVRPVRQRLVSVSRIKGNRTVRWLRRTHHNPFRATSSTLRSRIDSARATIAH
jgi:hypothetical protein